MYYPYFRGKQYELITIRENAMRMSQANIIPIIEPVKQNLSGLRRTLGALIEHDSQFVLVVNPLHGELNGNATVLIEEIVEEILSGYPKYSIGYLAHSNSSIEEIQGFCREQDNSVNIIHCGFQQGSKLSEALLGIEQISDHIFIEQNCSRLYRRNFKDKRRIIIRDGFVKRTNRDHPEVEHFSDLHITYEDEGGNGYGDFLIVGDEFLEGGGPAYAVAIHLTYIDENEENDMFIKHYISDRTNTPADPGGKFLEALEKLIEDVNYEGSNIFQSEAVLEFTNLHKRGHYPGLGYVKKLSMQHHIELMSNFLED